MRVEVEPTTAQVLAHADDNVPVVLTNPFGRGRVIAALPLVEDAILNVAGRSAARDRWTKWYAGMLGNC